MKFVKTHFIAIRAVPFMESSVIFQGISEKLGAVSLLVKGYKRPKSKIRGEIDILTVSEVIFYPKSTREIHPVTEAKMLQTFPEIYKNYYAMKECLKIGKMILKTTPSDNLSMSAFALFRGLLSVVNEKDGVCGESLYTGMLVKLLHLNGVFPKLTQCVRCGSSTVKYISLKAGGPLCQRCAQKEEDKTEYTVKIARELFFLMTRDFHEISRFKISGDTYELVRKMIEIHIVEENGDELEKDII